jgi:hypothetical protein
VLRGPREEFATWGTRKNVQHNRFVIGIRGVTVAFPIARIGIEFDRAALRITAAERDRRISKIGTRFAIPERRTARCGPARLRSS